MIPYFYYSSSVAQFPFNWSSIVAPSPLGVISNFSAKEKDNVGTLEKLS